MTSRSRPTPEQIAHTPELAILCALDELLDLASRTLIAAHPVLGDTDAPSWARDREPLGKAARVLIMRAATLHRAIRTYAVTATTQRAGHPVDDSDLSF